MNQEEEGANRLNERENKILQRAELYLSSGDHVDHAHDMLTFAWIFFVQKKHHRMGTH